MPRIVKRNSKMFFIKLACLCALARESGYAYGSHFMWFDIM